VWSPWPTYRDGAGDGDVAVAVAKIGTGSGQPHPPPAPFELRTAENPRTRAGFRRSYSGRRRGAAGVIDLPGIASVRRAFPRVTRMLEPQRRSAGGNLEAGRMECPGRDSLLSSLASI